MRAQNWAFAGAATGVLMLAGLMAEGQVDKIPRERAEKVPCDAPGAAPARPSGGEAPMRKVLATGAAYVGVFDKKTGTNRCRFSTMYFMNAAHRLAGVGQKQVTYEVVSIKQNQPQSVFRGHISAAHYKKWFKSDYGVGGERVEIPNGAALFGVLVLTDGDEFTVVPFYQWADGDTKQLRCQGFQLGRAPMFSASGATERAFFQDMKKRLEALD